MRKFENGFRAIGLYEEGYNEDLVVAILVTSIAFVLLGLCAAVMAAATGRAERNHAPTQRVKETTVTAKKQKLVL